jgi:hypothetical protein
MLMKCGLLGTPKEGKTVEKAKADEETRAGKRGSLSTGRSKKTSWRTQLLNKDLKKQIMSP